MQTSFFANKVKRQIAYNGQDFSFIKVSEDKYHQKNISNPIELNVRGIYHETVSYVSINGSDAGRIQKKPQPMILAMYKDCKDINVDDKVYIEGSQYKVTGKTDIKNLNVACDISLELIL